MQAANVHDGTGGDGVFNTPNKVVDNFKWTKKSKAFFFPSIFPSSRTTLGLHFNKNWREEMPGIFCELPSFREIKCFHAFSLTGYSQTERPTNGSMD